MNIKKIFPKSLYYSLTSRKTLLPIEAVFCSLYNNKYSDIGNIYVTFKRLCQNSININTLNDFKLTLFNSHKVIKNIKKKTLDNGSEVFSLKDNALQKLNIPIAAIVDNFDPIPVIENKDYINYLIFNQIKNPFNFYPKEHNKLIRECFEEIQPILDEYRTYYEFNLFPDIAEKLKIDNNHLYELLIEKQKNDVLLNNIVIDDHIINEYNSINRIKNKNFKDLMLI